jgi:hypothetical protein
MPSDSSSVSPLLESPHLGVPLTGTVKLAAQFLQCIADISTAPKDSLLSPGLLIVLYSLCFLLLIAEMGVERWEVGREMPNAEVLDRP